MTISILNAILANAQKVLAKSHDAAIQPMVDFLGEKLVEASQTDSAYNKEQTAFRCDVSIVNGTALYAMMKDFNIESIKTNVMPKVLDALGVSDKATMLSLRLDRTHKTDSEDVGAFLMRIKFELNGKKVDEVATVAPSIDAVATTTDNADTITAATTDVIGDSATDTVGDAVTE